MIKKIINYVKDDKLKIRYIDNNLNIENYDKILEVKEDIITLTKNNKIILIKGEKLKLSKLLDDEILIEGIIKKIEM